MGDNFEQYSKELTVLIEEINKFDFPFLAGEQKKLQIIQEKKKYIEITLRKFSECSMPEDEVLDRIWNEAISDAGGEFFSLPENVRLNGFYLQELMHEYAEKLVQYLITAKSDSNSQQSKEC